MNSVTLKIINTYICNVPNMPATEQSVY